MKKRLVSLSLSLLVFSIIFSFTKTNEHQTYVLNFKNKLALFEQNEHELIDLINQQNQLTNSNIKIIKDKILLIRKNFKGLDFWFRYLAPLAQKKINGPLPVEWETEVFEKYEKPYKREGAGFTLALQYLEEENIDKTHLLDLLNQSIEATQIYKQDSITKELNSFPTFYLSNRLYLLNLACIYTTGFDCPDKSSIIPELKIMLADVNEIYTSFNQSFPNNSLSNLYLNTYNDCIQFVNNQPNNFEQFDHFTFIRDHINPLFKINQEHIIKNKVYSKSLMDYSLNKNANSIFSKQLYNGQNTKGIYLRVIDENALTEINKLGKLLFYDPILSGNNERSCASCHKPTQFFTDTTISTAIQFNNQNALERNTPTLINAPYNHLIMADGKHIDLQLQTKGVITSNLEMNANQDSVLSKILSCKEYDETLQKLLKYTPTEKTVKFDHIISAITYYYSQFSNYDAPFDAAMNKQTDIGEKVKNGYNLFMGKAACATCHFAPQFNGVKPPYIGSEFEVIGVPENNAYTSISNDLGRYLINPAKETKNAFRTGTIRNAAFTKPYMHNGVFSTLEQVIDFYNTGGGNGNGLHVNNQTLPSDSLLLTENEKENLILFINSLTEKVIFEPAPKKLPKSNLKYLNKRKIGGSY